MVAACQRCVWRKAPAAVRRRLNLGNQRGAIVNADGDVAFCTSGGTAKGWGGIIGGITRAQQTFIGPRIISDVKVSHRGWRHGINREIQWVGAWPNVTGGVRRVCGEAVRTLTEYGGQFQTPVALGIGDGGADQRIAIVNIDRTAGFSFAAEHWRVVIGGFAFRDGADYRRVVIGGNQQGNGVRDFGINSDDKRAAFRAGKAAKADGGGELVYSVRQFTWRKAPCACTVCLGGAQLIIAIVDGNRGVGERGASEGRGAVVSDATTGDSAGDWRNVVGDNEV